MRPLVGHKGPVLSLAFSPDGRQLATGGADGDIRLWDPASGRWLRTIHNHACKPTAVVFSPSGRTLAAPGGWHPVRLHTLTGEPEFAEDALGGDGSELGTAAELFFTPDARFLVGRCVRVKYSGPDDQPPECISAAWRTARKHTGITQVNPFERNSPSPTGLAVAPTRTGGWAAVLGTAAGLWVWSFDLTQARVVEWGPPLGRVTAVACQPDAKVVAAAVGPAVVVLPVRKDPGPGVVCECGGGDVRALAFGPDGRSLLSGRADGLVVVHDAGTGVEVGRFDWGLGPVNAVAVAPDGLTAAAAGTGGATVFDLA